MKTRHLLLAVLSLLVGWGTVGVAQAAPPRPSNAPSVKTPVVSFEAGDRPGNFFTCSNTGNSKSIGCVPGEIGGAQQRSLAVIAPGETVGFPSASAEAETIHTAVTLLWPDGARRMPFKTAIDAHNPAPGGVATVTLREPGLYVFICDIHVYMFAAVIVDDPATSVDDPLNLVPGLGLDLGKKITLVNGITVPTYSDLAIRLLRTFFIVTDPGNWKDYTKTSWTPAFPPVPVIVYDVDGHRIDVANLSGVLSIGTVPLTGVDPVTGLPRGTFNPGPAVGEIWVDTQFELTENKSKPGTATAIKGADWTITKKIALPDKNMNHPHNMWTDKDQEVIYQTQWFSERMAVFNRTTGAFIRELNTGPAPSHVMTRANNDQVHVAQNGGNNVREFDTLTNTNNFIRDIPMGSGGEDVFTATHPHGHWMSHDGMKMVTPNENVNTSTVYNFAAGEIQATIPTGHTPIATGMMPDSSKYYVANLLDNTITVINTMTGIKIGDIDLLKIGTNYFPLDVANQGLPSPPLPVGALPIQTPVSPDGTNMVTANTLTATITIVDPTTDTVVAMLPCDPGCHGVQYGAKALPPGDTNPYGQYYAYVASKFSNALIVVDPDPNRDGNPIDAAIVGRVLLAGPASLVQDDSVREPNGNPGMGGQGVLPVPVVYNGWVQNLPAAWCSQLTEYQRRSALPAGNPSCTP